jgi:hypothetical protein
MTTVFCSLADLIAGAGFSRTSVTPLKVRFYSIIPERFTTVNLEGFFCCEIKNNEYICRYIKSNMATEQLCRQSDSSANPFLCSRLECGR